MKKNMIAIVDDDVRLTESLKDLFESADYAVLTYSSAKSLIETGLSGLDCLVTDIGMPVMDGFALYDAVRSERPDLPVFMITGRHNPADQARASSRSVSGFFYKPFDGQTLLTEVGLVLRAQRGDGEDV